MSPFLKDQHSVSLLVALVLSVRLLADSPWPAPSGRERTQGQIKQLIEMLGSADFEKRDAATTKLKTLESAEPLLRNALQSADLEVRLRLKEIISVLKEKRGRRCFDRALALGKEGRAVEMVDRLVYWRNCDKEGKGWDGLTRLADKLIVATADDVVPLGFPYTANFRQSPKFPAGDFVRYRDLARPKEFQGDRLTISSHGRLLLRGENLTTTGRFNPGIQEGIACVTDHALLFGVCDSVVVVGGDVELRFLERSILICDGNVNMEQKPTTGLIIARGKVTCRQGKLTKSGCIIRAENYYQNRKGEKRILKDGVADPVGFVKFFELEDVGVTAVERDPKAQPSRDGVCLKAIRKDSPFASGLHSGDVITALDGTKVASPEVLRRLLRRSLARGGPTLTFTVQRSGKTLDLSIPVKD